MDIEYFYKKAAGEFSNSIKELAKFLQLEKPILISQTLSADKSKVVNKVWAIKIKADSTEYTLMAVDSAGKKEYFNKSSKDVLDFLNQNLRENSLQTIRV